MAAQHGVRFLKSLSPSTHAILHTQACTDTHISTFTLPLDFDPPPSLCISYELSEKTQWIEGRDQRPDLLIGQAGAETGWLCVYEHVCAYIYVCVCLIFSTVTDMFVCGWIQNCQSLCVQEPQVSIFYYMNHQHTHPHFSIPLIFEAWSGGQVTGF